MSPAFLYRFVGQKFNNCTVFSLSLLFWRLFLGVHENMDFIYSQRGRPLIVVDGYLYRKNRGAYWRCIRCTKYRCKSRLILRPNREPVCIAKHSHGPEKEKIEWGRKVRSNAVYIDETADEETPSTPRKEIIIKIDMQQANSD